MAEDLAAGRDAHVAKKVTKKVLVTIAKIGSRWIFVEDFKDVGEILGALGAGLGVWKSMRERRNQAKAAAVFLRWLQATYVIAMGWAIEAQVLLDVLTGQKPREFEVIVGDLQQRMHLETIRWKSWV